MVIISECEEQHYSKQTNSLHLTVNDQKRLVKSLNNPPKPSKSMIKGLNMYDEYLKQQKANAVA